MADSLIPGGVGFDWVGMVSSGASIVKWSFWILLIGGSIIVALMWFVNSKKWNKQVTIKQQTGNQALVRFGKAKDQKDKDGSVWWIVKLKGVPGKIKTLVPPKESISILSSGLIYAEGELTPAGDIVWTISTQSVARSLSPEEKAVLAEEFENSESWSSQKKGGLEKLMQFVNMMMPFLIIALLVFGAGEYMGPAIKLNEQNLQSQTLQLEISQSLIQLKQDIREIKSEVSYEGNRSVQGGAPQ